MADFSSLFDRLLDLAEQDMRPHFSLQRDTLVEGRWVALEAFFDLDGERKTFGLIPTGRRTHCHERCLFIPIEHLTEEDLAEALSYITRVHDHLVAPDKTHEFSLFSLVIVSDGVDKKLRKPLHKYIHDVRHKPPHAGWSSVRVAVVDLPRGTVRTNHMGAALGDRLKPTLEKLR